MPTSKRQFTCLNGFEIRQIPPKTLDKTYFCHQIPLISAHLVLFCPFLWNEMKRPNSQLEVIAATIWVESILPSNDRWKVICTPPTMTSANVGVLLQHVLVSLVTLWPESTSVPESAVLFSGTDRLDYNAEPLPWLQAMRHSRYTQNLLWLYSSLIFQQDVNCRVCRSKFCTLLDLVHKAAELI